MRFCLLILPCQVRTENEKLSVQPDDHVKKFKLPQKHLHQEEFVRCVQECGIVKDVATIHRLFDALTDGESGQAGWCVCVFLCACVWFSAFGIGYLSEYFVTSS